MAASRSPARAYAVCDWRLRVAAAKLAIPRLPCVWGLRNRLNIAFFPMPLAEPVLVSFIGGGANPDNSCESKDYRR